MTPTEDAERTLVDRFRRQAASAAQRSSPLYRALLAGCIDDLQRRGPIWHVVRDRAAEPAGDAIPLRLLACVHRLVLTRQLPALERWYPSVGGKAPAAEAWPAFQEAVEQRAPELSRLLDRPLQTNEVGRCSALILGLLAITARDPLPVVVLEIGSSAGLNLNWHHYRYSDPTGGARWGPVDSPVRLPLASGTDVDRLAVAGGSRGCDRAPLDAGSEDDRLWLRACVWADQLHRLRLLDAALAVSSVHVPHVDRSDAVAWLHRQLAEPRTGVITVIAQTIVQQYLSAEQRRGVAAAIDRAGRSAQATAPVAWVRVEPPDDPSRLPPSRQGLTEIRVVRWPTGAEHLVGYSGYHGQPVIPAASV